MREILPSPPQKVRIRVPEGRKVSKVTLLVNAKTPPHRVTGSVVTIDIPSIDLHEVVACDLA